MRLKDKVAIVTGGANGIGQAVCLGYAKEGARVIIADIDETAGRDTADRISAAGREAKFIKCDVSMDLDVKHMVEETINTYGVIDILVNNAGIDTRYKLKEITESDWDRVLAINLKSQFLCSRRVIPSMQERKKGKIINVGSIVYYVGFIDLIPYSASKGGVIGLTRALARELGEYHINVNSIAPGAIQTERELDEFPDQEALAKDLAAKQCIPTRIKPEDLVGIFVFLASSDSDPITGQTILVDSGWRFI